MRVLLIDDDARLAQLLDDNLRPQGVALVHSGGGQAGLAALATGGFDAVLLDVMMPGLDGLSVLRTLRDAGHRVPVIMLTARGDEADRVVGLELGADDYVTKPFSPRELALRVRAVLSRRRLEGPSGGQLRRDPLRVDPERHRCWVKDEEVVLTAKEFQLLVSLMRRPGRVYKLEDGKPVPVLIRVGLSDGQRSEVLDGLAEGDKVIVGGGDAAGGAQQQRRRGPF